MDFLCFTPNANPEIPTNGVLLPRALAATGNRVFMVEVHDRSNRLSVRPWEWSHYTLRGGTDPLVLEYVPALPMKLGFTARLERTRLKRLVQRVLRDRWGVDKAVQIVFGPNEVRYREVFPDFPYIYRVIDDYPTMPFYASDRDGCRRADEQLCREAVAVFPSNPKLLAQRAGFNAHHLLVPNGVDYVRFSQENPPVPEDLSDLPRPLIGFTGAIDRYKLDMDLLAAIAASRPHWSIVLVGKVGTDDDTSEGELPQAPNLHYMGFRPYESLPAYTSAFDVGIIPYDVNPYTEGVSPLKLYEYLAAGKGVVTTPLPFAAEAGDAVRVAATPEEFVSALEQTLDEGDLAPDRRRLAEQNSWAARAHAITDYLASI